MSEWSASSEATRVWAIFSGMYGTRHTRDFGESVPDVWRQAIAGLKRHEIERGLRRLTAQGSGSPPTLPQFMKACRQVGDEGMGAENPSGQKVIEQKFDPIMAHANKCLFAFLSNNGAATESSLSHMIAEKNRIAEQFIEIAIEETPTGSEIRDAIFKAMRNIFQPAPKYQV